MNALILVDIQKDFLPGGALAVKNGDQIIPLVNELMEMPFDLIVATKDWHPKGHFSFASTHRKNVREKITIDGIEQILWPDHCVQETEGAEFPSGFFWHKVQHTFYKGTDIKYDSYSAFFDNGHHRSTGLEDFLKQYQITHVYLAGLSTDYCIKYSALDANKQGFKVTVIKDACKAINIHPGDEERALKQIEDVGVNIVTLNELRNCCR